MSDTIHSRELIARDRKARAIVAWLREHEMAAADAPKINAEQRIAIAKDAGQRPPSETTWQYVCDLLAGGDGLSAVEQIEHKQGPDLASAARLLADLKAQRKELDLRIEEAEDAVLAAMGDEWEQTIDGFGTVKRHSGRTRKSWDHDALYMAVVRSAKACPCGVDKATGEVEPESEHVVRHLRECVGKSAWRTTGLKALDIDADEYAEATTGRPTVELVLPS